MCSLILTSLVCKIFPCKFLGLGGAIPQKRVCYFHLISIQPSLKPPRVERFWSAYACIEENPCPYLAPSASITSYTSASSSRTSSGAASITCCVSSCSLFCRNSSYSLGRHVCSLVLSSIKLWMLSRMSFICFSCCFNSVSSCDYIILFSGELFKTTIECTK